MHGLVHLWSLTVIATFNVGNIIYRRNSDLELLYLRLQPVLHFDLSHCQQPLVNLPSLVTRLLFRHLTRQNYLCCYFRISLTDHISMADRSFGLPLTFYFYGYIVRPDCILTPIGSDNFNVHITMHILQSLRINDIHKFVLLFHCRTTCMGILIMEYYLTYNNCF